MTAAPDSEVYVAALAAHEIFSDPTYQRVLDVPRARKMAGGWDRRLAGILEVSDRGEHNSPRYAVLDGQHRWAAARFLKTPPVLVANVHSGLSVADEAELFEKLNRERRQITTWDRWRARRASADPVVLAIENTVAAAGLTISESKVPAGGSVSCVSTLEKIATSRGGINLLDNTLNIVRSAYGRDRTAYEAPVVHGLALILDTFPDTLDLTRLVNILSDLPTKRIRLSGITLRDTGIAGTLPKLYAMAIVNHYNQTPGRKLAWPPRWNGVFGKPAKEPRPRPPALQAPTKKPDVVPIDKVITKRPSPPTPPPAPPRQVPAEPPTADASEPWESLSLSAPAEKRAMPDGMPPLATTYTEAQADAVCEMEDQPVSVIADQLGLSERTVRRILADNGYDKR